MVAAAPLLPADALEGVLTAVDLLRSCFPLEDELAVPDDLVDALRAAVAAAPADTSTPVDDDPGETHLALRLRVDVDGDHSLEVEIVFPLRQQQQLAADRSVIDPPPAALPSCRPTLTLVQPSWLSNAAFRTLADQIADDSSAAAEEEPTALVLDFVQRLQKAAPTFLSPLSVASTRSSFDGSVDDLTLSTGGLQLDPSMSKELLICVSKMHHIRNMSKFKKLKGFALAHGASGFARAGRPGVLLYEVEGREALARFLEAVRGLKYLEFHHLGAAPLEPSSDAPPFASPAAPAKPARPPSKPAPPARLNGGTPGLQKVDDMKDLILAADSVGRKEWFRSALGMTSKGG